MIYELVVRIFGAGIAGIIQFLPLVLDYNAAEPALSARTMLTMPVTAEARHLAEKGTPFRVDYSWSLIVNDSRAYRRTARHELTFNAGAWLVDRVAVAAPFDSVQLRMGRLSARFSGLKFDEGDRIVLFVKAVVGPDSSFTASTRMRTEVLWNCYIPTRKEQYLFTGGRFVQR